MSKKKLLSIIQESETSLHRNVNFNYVIKEYQSILENIDDCVENHIGKLEPEMITVFGMANDPNSPCDQDFTYLIRLDDIMRYANESAEMEDDDYIDTDDTSSVIRYVAPQVDYIKATNDIIVANNRELPIEAEPISQNNMRIIIHDKNHDSQSVYESVRQNPNTFFNNISKIKEYTDIIKQLSNAGYKFCKRF